MGGNRIENYLHLNSSFSDHLGLLEGKSAAVLYFSVLEDTFYADDISFSFMEEILGQISMSTPMGYGSGLAGIGSLLNFLQQRSQLEGDPAGIFAEPEALLLKTLLNAELRGLNLVDGVAGLGMYFLFRLGDRSLPQDSFQTMRYREAVIASIDQIEHVVQRTPDVELLGHGVDIWSGWSGVYLYLLKTSQLGCCLEVIAELIQKLRLLILDGLHSIPLYWHQLEGWFALFQDPALAQDKSLIGQFQVYLDQVSAIPMDFYTSAFHGLLLKLMGEQTGLALAGDVGQQLEAYSRKTLEINSLGKLFPADPQTGAIPMGLDHGVAGTALALDSLESGKLDWLTLLGR